MAAWLPALRYSQSGTSIGTFGLAGYPKPSLIVNAIMA
jgi:hypothetical protein